MDRERKDAEERCEKVTTEFTETRFGNARVMTIRKTFGSVRLHLEGHSLQR